MPPRPWRRRATVILGWLLPIALLWWTLRDVSARQIWDLVRNANVGLVVLGGLLGLSNYPLRAHRWQLVLAGAGWRAPRRELLVAAILAAFANNVLPARAGEAVGVWVAQRRAGVPAAVGASSVGVLRILDGLALAFLLGLGLLAGGTRAEASIFGLSAIAVSAVMMAAFGGLLAVLAVAAWTPERLRPIVEPVLRRLPETLAQRTRSVGGRFIGGLGVLRNPRRAAAAIGWSLVIWAIGGLGFTAGLQGFGIDAGWRAGLVIQGTVVLAIALPSTPGFFGPFEAGVRLGAGWYGVTGELAGAVALPLHIAVFLIPLVVLGWMVAAIAGFDLLRREGGDGGAGRSDMARRGATESDQIRADDPSAEAETAHPPPGDPLKSDILRS